MKNQLKPLFVANWKMNLTKDSAKQLIGDIKKMCKFPPNVEVVVCPTHLKIPIIFDELRKTPIVLGAQDTSWLNSGSLTGEVSPVTLRDYGVEYVIVGHSERRHQLGETNKMINAKMKACLKNGLHPILCVGETFEERQEGRKEAVISQQLREGLEGVVLDSKHQLIVAYEPVWVIGSGQAVDPREAEHIAEVIRQEVFDFYHGHEKDLDEYLRVLYGGSVSSENIENFVKGSISGVLVGGASLKVDEFNKMLQLIS